MAAGVIIGRVSVKVIPDTSDFKESLRRDLERIERSLDPIEIEIEVDTEGVAREAGRARDRAQEQMKDLRLKVNLDNEESIRRSLGQLNRELERLGEIDLDVDLNEDDLNAALDLLNEQLEGVRRIKIQVDEADPADVARAVDSINRELEKIKRVELDISYDEVSLTRVRDRLRDQMNDTYRQIRDDVQRQLKDIQIGMDVDPVKAARTIRKIEALLEQIEDAKMTITPEMDDRARVATERKIQALRDEVSDLEATIHPDLDSPAALSVLARLKIMARDRFVEFVPRMNNFAVTRVASALNRMSGARLISGYMGDLYRSIINFDRAIPKVIGLSLAVAGLGAAGLASSSNLLALSSSLASIAPAGLALPGILGGIAVGVGVMVAALRDFSEVFPDVEATLSKMQDSISDKFWAGAKASMREMIDKLLPAMARGFDQVAVTLGNFFAKLSKAVTQQLVPALGPMFDSLAKSIDIASEAADNIVGIITTLGTVGSSYLPRLAKWFADVTTKFDEFLKRSLASGEIFDWIDEGIEALKALGRVIKSTFQILGDLSRAATAGGGATLSIFADTLERIRNVTKGQAFQTGLADVFRSAHVAMSNIARVSGPAVEQFFKGLGKLISGTLPTVGLAIGEVVKGIATALNQPEVSVGIKIMFDGILRGIRSLEPAFAPLGRAIGTLGPLVSALAQNLGKVLGAAIPPVADALVRLGEALEPLIPAMGELLLAAVMALTPVIESLADAFVSFLEGGALDVIVGLLGKLGEVIIAIPTPLLTGIVVVIGALALAAGLLSVTLSAANVIVGIWSVVSGIAAVATAAFGVAMAILTAPITLIILGILALVAAGILLYKNWDVISAQAKVIWQAIKDEVVNSFKNMVDQVQKGWKAIKDEFSASWNNLKSQVTAGWNAVKNEFTASWSNLKAQVTNGWNAVKNEFTASWNNLKSQVNNGWSAVKQEFSASWANLKAQTNGAWSAIKTEFSSSWANLKSQSSGGWSAVKQEFSASWANLKSQSSGGWSAIRGEFSASWANLKGTVSSGWAAVRGEFSSSWANLKSTVTSGWASVRSAFADGANAIRSAAVAAWNGVVGAFRGGVNEAVGLVRGLGGMIAGAVGNLGGILIGAGRSVIDGFISGLSEGFRRVRSTLGNLTAMLPNWKGPAERDASILTNSGKLVIGGFIDGLESQYAAVKRSLGGLSDDLASSFGQPITADLRANLPKTDVRKGMIGSLKTAMSDQQSVANGKTLIYNAAPGSSLGSEEDLFAAADRGRMVGW